MINMDGLNWTEAVLALPMWLFLKAEIMPKSKIKEWKIKKQNKNNIWKSECEGKSDLILIQTAWLKAYRVSLQLGCSKPFGD